MSKTSTTAHFTRRPEIHGSKISRGLRGLPTEKGQSVFLSMHIAMARRHWELVKRIRELNRRYAPGEWQALAQAADLRTKPAEPPGRQPMDPLKRWVQTLRGLIWRGSQATRARHRANHGSALGQCLNR